LETKPTKNTPKISNGLTPLEAKASKAGLRMREHIMIIVLAVILILGGIYFIPRWLTPQASYVFYWCSKNKTAFPRTTQIYPPIKEIPKDLDVVSNELNANSNCTGAVIQAWQNVDCPECKKEAEIKRLEKELLKQVKEIQRLGRGGSK
jgi:hypothetical protein